MKASIKRAIKDHAYCIVIRGKHIGCSLPTKTLNKEDSNNE